MTYAPPRVSVSCKSCGTSWLKRKNDIPEWSGFCQACANKRRVPRRTFVEVSCRQCGGVKTLPSNVVPLWAGICRKCAPALFDRVCCKQCGSEWDKRRSNLAEWSGLCRSCERKGRFLDPAYLERHRHVARALVAKLGGIPNRKLFTTERVSGANANTWKGGVTPEHQRIRTSSAYLQWRKKVFVRDNSTCVWCGQVGGDIHADHIQLFSTHPELRLEPSNGRTLCVPCHKKRHAKCPE